MEIRAHEILERAFMMIPFRGPAAARNIGRGNCREDL
jgi:hypothetical protein